MLAFSCLRHALSRTALIAPLVLLVLLNPCLRAAQAQRQAPAQQACTITRVTDGDTVHASCHRPKRNHRIRIRLKGIDAPESDQAYGQAATERLRNLCLYQTVDIPRRPTKDRYKRVLADLHCRGQDAGEYMVSAGYAWYYRGTARQYPKLVQLEAQAKQGGWGLWAQPHPTPPWTWRHSRRR